MVLILDGNYEIGAPISIILSVKEFVWIENGHKSAFFPRIDLFSFIRAQHGMSYHLI